jgi:ATP-dependent helicase YprA (DUF1998 family)
MGNRRHPKCNWHNDQNVSSVITIIAITHKCETFIKSKEISSTRTKHKNLNLIHLLVEWTEKTAEGKWSLHETQNGQWGWKMHSMKQNDRYTVPCVSRPLTYTTWRSDAIFRIHERWAMKRSQTAIIASQLWRENYRLLWCVASCSRITVCTNIKFGRR